MDKISEKYGMNGIVNFNWNTKSIYMVYDAEHEKMKINIIDCIAEYVNIHEDFGEKIDRHDGERDSIKEEIANMVIKRDKTYMKHYDEIIKEIGYKIYNIDAYYRFRINDVQKRDVEKKIKEIKESIKPEIDKLEDELKSLRGTRSFIDY